LAEGIGKCQAESLEGDIETRLDDIAAAAKNVRSAGLGKELSAFYGQIEAVMGRTRKLSRSRKRRDHDSKKIKSY
ncbi:MAG: hypothetical protein MPW15_02755, partial [Candidatus Manganitrophus sp.]|nr:hypothetical protein [Candidatus Manganitrophus sp.]